MRFGAYVAGAGLTEPSGGHEAGETFGVGAPIAVRNDLEGDVVDAGKTGGSSVEEARHFAADQVSMSNSIGSLRYLSALDWRKFVETMSVVERTLREDVGGVYGRMEFATRDRYRHVVEKIAKHSGRLECDVACKAIELTQASAAVNGAEDRAAHVGFYLVGEGLGELERAWRMSRTSQSI